MAGILTRATDSPLLRGKTTVRHPWEECKRTRSDSLPYL